MSTADSSCLFVFAATLGGHLVPVKQETSTEATDSNSITCRVLDPIYQGRITDQDQNTSQSGVS
jgi:hypothetical protein